MTRHVADLYECVWLSRWCCFYLSHPTHYHCLSRSVPRSGLCANSAVWIGNTLREFVLRILASQHSWLLRGIADYSLLSPPALLVVVAHCRRPVPPMSVCTVSPQSARLSGSTPMLALTTRQSRLAMTRRVLLSSRPPLPSSPPHIVCCLSLPRDRNLREQLPQLLFSNPRVADALSGW